MSDLGNSGVIVPPNLNLHILEDTCPPAGALLDPEQGVQRGAPGGQQRPSEVRKQPTGLSGKALFQHRPFPTSNLSTTAL